MGRLRSHPAPLDSPKLDGWHVVLPHRHQGSKPYRRGSASLGTQEPQDGEQEASLALCRGRLTQALLSTSSHGEGKIIAFFFFFTDSFLLLARYML